GGVDHLARLTRQPHLPVVVGQNPDRSGMPHLLACDLFAIRVAEALDGHGGDLALVLGLSPEAIKPFTHLPQPPPRARLPPRTCPPARRRSRARPARGCARCRLRGSCTGT